MSEFAEVFRANDQKVLQFKTPLSFLEVQPCADGRWRVFLVEKSFFFRRR